MLLAMPGIVPGDIRGSLTAEAPHFATLNVGYSLPPCQIEE